MKAIIICDDEELIGKVDAALASLSYDTIIYRWLLKALDNIEEIRPDIVVVSASDYPRHWKTLTQFIKSGIAGKIPDVILYAPKSFSETEKMKAQKLGIKGIFHSCDEDGMSFFRSIVNSPTGALSPDPEKADKERSAEAASISETLSAEALALGKIGTAVFTHPKTGAFVTGTIRSLSDGNAEFTADIPCLTAEIASGDRIEELSMRTSGVPTYCTASVVSAGNEIIIRPDKA
ncbi:hypothetical protein [Treponema sp. Marseille-Q4132]|uniref:hypothetical protein n=1 Tax=Treponema sp. Marseille-Q4132 TaxID=2766701 RepID=UPI001652D0E5|nr:hypothetical protein [Treponema sp. Marseille-Q4132]QNL97454.1 hypothetical protein H9I35_01480 [Treponema sp. Marseille-Q4132]